MTNIATPRRLDASVFVAKNFAEAIYLTDTSYNVTKQCVDDVIQVSEDMIAGKDYAIQMFDAAGKIPPGVLEGNYQWIGSSDECRDVNDIMMNGTTINGEYCLLFLPLAGGASTLQYGLCLPDSCEDNDVLELVNRGLVTLAIPGLQVIDVHCTQDYELTTGAIITIVISTLLCLFIVVGTSLDFYIYYKYKKKEEIQKDEFHVGNGAVTTGLHGLDETSPLIKSPSYSPGVFARIILSFSVHENASKILDTTHASGTLACIHGIRVLSMWWVIQGHVYVFTPLFTDNLLEMLNYLRTFSFQAILNGTVSVDTFFLLSGLLVTYLTLKELESGRQINWIIFYVHRYWRLTPLYGFVLLVWMYLFLYVGRGPLQWTMELYVQSCYDWWWTNLLYINNLVPFPGNENSMCMAWTWYLANDMQFYVISPIIIVLLHKKWYFGMTAIVTFLCGCFAATAALTVEYGIPVNMLQSPYKNVTDPTAGFAQTYTKPYTRIAPYLVGMVVGYLLVKTKGKIKIPTVVNLICWVAAWAVAIAVVYGLHGTYNGKTLSLPVNVFYATVFRFAWAVAVGWLIFACITGHGGPINAFLSWKAWIPLSRLTYSTYLIHLIVQYTYLYAGDRLVHISHLNMTYSFIASMALSYSLAFVFSIMAEAPMMRLEKIVLNKIKRE
ncbi:nose resistant to fluoxetine protein 6-like [Saccoglossus kowalevskii]